jgi:hypothetical protein
MAGHVAYMRKNDKAYEAFIRKIKRNTAVLAGL